MINIIPKNPIVKILFRKFINTVYDMINDIIAKDILEVGCGEGYLSNIISGWKNESQIHAIDIGEEIFDSEVRKNQRIHFSVQSIYNLGYQRETFDLVIASEILEHLEEPDMAMQELDRVTSRYLLFSVPREPIWRILNVLRHSYNRFGEHPRACSALVTEGFYSFRFKVFQDFAGKKTTSLDSAAGGEEASLIGDVCLIRLRLLRT